MIFGAWFSGLIISISFSFWAIVAVRTPRSACLYVPSVIPTYYTYLWDVGKYYVSLLILIVMYGRILCVAWRHHVAISAQQLNCRQPTRSRDIDLSVGPQSGDLGPSEPGETDQQQDFPTTSTIRKCRRQFKAAYLTGAIVGSFMILWLPYTIARTLQIANVGPATRIRNTISVVSALGNLGTCFNWMLYGLASKTFRKAYKNLFLSIVPTCHRHRHQ